MVLKSLELSGFKSFAKKAELEFSSSITAIVGPNGSGKSNVAEAFRFVLGEQSIKSMRGKRTEDLIWNGTREVPRSSRASVKIKLNNETGVFDVDFSEVEIERVIHRDTSNEYNLNGSQARLKDVIELVTAANIGTSGHHIISQGEADRILNVNSKDRKGMIEDALGLKIFEIRKNEALRKLERTQENIKEVSMMRRELAPHIKFLGRQVEKIKEAENLKEQLKSLYREYFKRESTYVEYHKEVIDKNIQLPRQELEELERKLVEAKEKASQKELTSPLLGELEKIERQVEEIRREKNTHTRDVGRLEGEMASDERSLERQRKLKEIQARKTIAVGDLINLKDKLIEAFRQREGSFSLSDIEEITRQVFDVFVNSVGEKSPSESSEIKDISKDLDDKRQKRVELQGRLKALDEKEAELNQIIKQKETLLEKEKDSYRDAEKLVYMLQAKRSELKGKVDDLISKKERISLEEEELKREIGEAAVLVGREAVNYSSIEIADDKGKLSSQEIAEEDRSLQKDRQKQIERLKIKLEDMGQGGGEEILQEYKESKDRDEFLASEVGDLEASSEKLNNLIEDLDTTINEKFKEGISKINNEFEKFFSIMFGGGKASLSVKKIKKPGISEEGLDEDILEEGVEISVSLPRKRIKSLEMLSGGERALTSIALLFAMSQVNPPPFIILDETDAALDEANSKRYGDMIESLSKDSQLILITHNRETMSRAGVLYGVTMGGDGVSRLLSVKFEEAVEVAK